MGASLRCILARAGALCAAALLSGAASVAAQESPEGLSFEIRGGLAFSTVLAEDAVADASMMRLLLSETALPERSSGPVRLMVPPAPMVAVGASTPLGPGWRGELEAGWTFAGLEAEDGNSTWRLERMNVVHAALGARFYPRELYYLRGGVGLIRYSGEGYGIFRDGAELTPMLHTGIGTERAFDRFSIAVELAGQAHRFGTVPIREARGRDGTIYRGVLQVSVGFGRGGT